MIPFPGAELVWVRGRLHCQRCAQAFSESESARSSPAFAKRGETVWRPNCFSCNNPIPAGDICALIEGHNWCATCCGRLNRESTVFSVLRRETAEKCMALVERVIAAQGDVAEPLLVKLQHDLAEELQISK